MSEVVQTRSTGAGIGSEVDIRELHCGEDASSFRSLNEEWIRSYFTLEPKDREVLGDPEAAILKRGGRIFLAWYRGESVGCVALIPMGRGVFELSKMAVAPHLRGLGVGRRLLLHAIEHARHGGAKSLFLGSSTKLPTAVRLYESVGFKHVPVEQLPPLPYSRADVFMSLVL